MHYNSNNPDIHYSTRISDKQSVDYPYSSTYHLHMSTQKCNSSTHMIPHTIFVRNTLPYLNRPTHIIMLPCLCHKWLHYDWWKMKLSAWFNLALVQYNPCRNIVWYVPITLSAGFDHWPLHLYLSYRYS